MENTELVPTKMDAAIATDTIKTYLADNPDPVKVATDLVPRLTELIQLATLPEEANNVRTLLGMSVSFLKQQLPKVIKGRIERYKLMHPAEVGYVEAAAKAGELWEGVPNKTTRADNQYASPEQEKQSVIDAGFRSAGDAGRCVGVGKWHEEDRRTYYEMAEQEFDHVTLNRAYSLWRSKIPRSISEKRVLGELNLAIILNAIEEHDKWLLDDECKDFFIKYSMPYDMIEEWAKTGFHPIERLFSNILTKSYKRYCEENDTPHMHQVHQNKEK